MVYHSFFFFFFSLLFPFSNELASSRPRNSNSRSQLGRHILYFYEVADQPK